VAHNTLFKAGRVVWCGAVGYASGLRDVARATSLKPDAFHPTPGSKRSSQLHKMYQRRCMAKNSWWWAKRLPETCRVVIPIKLEFSASVGFIHKEVVLLLHVCSQISSVVTFHWMQVLPRLCYSVTMRWLPFLRDWHHCSTEDSNKQDCTRTSWSPWSM